MKTAKNAAEETKKAKVRNAKNAIVLEKRRVAADRRKLKANRTKAKKFLAKYMREIEKEIEQKIRAGKQEASLCWTYPEETVIDLVIETLNKQGYRTEYSMYHDNEGPDLHSLTISWNLED